MKILVFISVFLIIVTACGQRIYDRWQVKCDSGFETPVSHWTYIDDGAIHWRVNKKGQSFVRKMLPGEVCTDKRIKMK